MMGLLPMAKPKPKATTTTNTHNNNNTSSDMGLLLVFFPQDNANTKIKTNLNFPSSSKSPTSTPTPTFKRTNSNNPLISKAQSTISICAFLLFVTLLLFTLSTFEPTIPNNTTPSSRRLLLHKPPIPPTKSKTQNWLPKLWHNKPQNDDMTSRFTSTALQRMGTLYRRGTKAMTDLVVCHVADETSEHDFRLFLRLIHRSGLTARSDVVFLFASHSLSSSLAQVIREENDAFSSLVEFHTELNSTRIESSFDLTRFLSKVGGKKGAETGEPIWGKRIRSNLSNPEVGNGESDSGGGNVLSFGSVLSFEASELDPENSLAGFVDRVPLSLRRWACYPMLLGRVRHNFKHVMLVDVKSVLVVNDPLGRVRNRSPESVFLFAKAEKHGKKNSDKTHSSQNRVESSIVMGGARGVRRLANAVLVEIVRTAMQHKKKNTISESTILSQLFGNEFMLKSKNINFINSDESIPEASSLASHNSDASTSFSKYAIIQQNHEVSTVIKKQICSSVLDSSVYRDC